VQNTLGCVDWACACGHLSLGVSAVSSLAIAWCSATEDVAVATSIFEGFCGQYTGYLSTTGTFPQGPGTTAAIGASTTGIGPVSTGTATTTTGTALNTGKGSCIVY
jgi:hypothetical protein